MSSDPTQSLFNLAMSEEAKPLFFKVKEHIEKNIDPLTEEYFSYDKDKADRWSFHPRQLEIIEETKAKAREAGLWNFFLPDDEYGQGLSNLDYAYIAAETGKSPLSAQSMNCAAPDTCERGVVARGGSGSCVPQRNRRAGLRPLDS